MLYYVPLEPYEERYTGQLSRPVTGWLERNWRSYGVQYQRVDGTTPPRDRVTVGKVLDAVGRGQWACGQVINLLGLLDNGRITSDDVIYFDDFWTPGFEALPYAFHLYGVRPKMYAYCWAQSVDRFDFTAKMLPWIRGVEKGIADSLTGVFVANTLLKELLRHGLDIPPEKIHVVGLPYCSEEVAEHYAGWGPLDRGKAVVFSSRWDAEKQPQFFLDVARAVARRDPEVRFTVLSGAASSKFRDENNHLKPEFREAVDYVGPALRFLTGLRKGEYYARLRMSRVQFNCALQDWVSFTLLEAAQAGCYPVYPNYRSFPETFRRHNGHLYPAWDAVAAAEMILDLMRRPLQDEWSYPARARREWIYTRFDLTWARMAWLMGFRESATEAFATQVDGHRHPYAPDKMFWEELS